MKHQNYLTPLILFLSHDNYSEQILILAYIGSEDKTRKLTTLKAVQSCAQPKNVVISEQIIILFYMWAEPSVTAV